MPIVQVAEFIILCLSIYLVAGIVFAVPFLMRGVEQVDEGAQGTGVWFRMTILPGVILLWPLMVQRWRAAIQTDQRRNRR
ncbi:MAG TPA: hypothetical protein VEF04_08105 [Blastocatellia bacterium]|nr:hypothetical protein [Blastocatellia bacterium]